MDIIYSIQYMPLDDTKLTELQKRNLWAYREEQFRLEQERYRLQTATADRVQQIDAQLADIRSKVKEIQYEVYPLKSNDKALAVQAHI